MNTGSFGAPAGGLTPELQEAMARRGGGMNMNAVTQTAPTFDPNAQPVNPIPQPSAPATPKGLNQDLAIPEAQIIIKALEGRLKSLSKQDEMKAGIGGL